MVAQTLTGGAVDLALSGVLQMGSFSCPFGIRAVVDVKAFSGMNCLLQTGRFEVATWSARGTNLKLMPPAGGGSSKTSFATFLFPF